MQIGIGALVWTPYRLQVLFLKCLAVSVWVRASGL
jgi:hypothetical protein